MFLPFNGGGAGKKVARFVSVQFFAIQMTSFYFTMFGSICADSLYFQIECSKETSRRLTLIKAMTPAQPTYKHRAVIKGQLGRHAITVNFA